MTELTAIDAFWRLWLECVRFAPPKAFRTFLEPRTGMQLETSET